MIRLHWESIVFLFLRWIASVVFLYLPKTKEQYTYLRDYHSGVKPPGRYGNVPTALISIKSRTSTILSVGGKHPKANNSG